MHYHDSLYKFDLDLFKELKVSQRWLKCDLLVFNWIKRISDPEGIYCISKYVRRYNAGNRSRANWWEIQRIFHGLWTANPLEQPAYRWKGLRLISIFQMKSWCLPIGSVLVEGLKQRPPGRLHGRYYSTAQSRWPEPFLWPQDYPNARNIWKMGMQKREAIPVLGSRPKA